MPDVVTPFNRKQATQTAPAETGPRHRRDGYFDDHDRWHEAADSHAAANG
jgi:hypothetical protein